VLKVPTTLLSAADPERLWRQITTLPFRLAEKGALRKKSSLISANVVKPWTAGVAFARRRFFRLGTAWRR